MMRTPLHPLTLWIGAMITAVAVAINSSYLFNIGVVGALVLLVLIRRDGSPWNSSFWWALKIGAFILAIRAIFGALIGVPIPGTVIFTVPRLSLPTWMPGIRIGGDVTLERLSSSIAEGLTIATIIALFGAASALTSPHKLLRVLPFFIYEIGITLVIATTVFPQLAVNVRRIRTAQRMRGIEKLSISSIATPLLEQSLIRSLQLAESMDARGFGVSRKRSRYRPSRWQLRDSLYVASTSAIAIVSFAS